MTLRHLKIFVEVCEKGGVTRAAESLHIVQPVVSTAVSELEKYYGVRLFDRISRRLVLTGEGKLLLLKAKEVLTAFGDFERLAGEGSERPVVRIGSSLTIAKEKLPRIITEVRGSFPTADLRIDVNTTLGVEKKLISGDLDFGFVEGKITFPEIKPTPICSDRLVAVCAVSYDCPDSLSVSKLASERLLLREAGSASRDSVDRLFAASKLTCDPVMTSVSNSALISACAAGFGITVLPEDLLRGMESENFLREIKIKDADLTRESCLIIHRNKRLSQVQRSVCALCLSALREEKIRNDSCDNGS